MENGNRYAKTGRTDRSVFTLTILESQEIVVAMSKMDNSMRTWVNALRACFGSPLSLIKYGGAITAAHREFVRPYALVQPICFDEIVCKSVGSPSFYNWLDKLCELPLCDATSKLAFDPGSWTLPPAGVLAMLASVPPTIGKTAVHTVLQTASQIKQRAPGGVSDASFSGKKLDALLSSFDLAAFETRVDLTTSAAFLVWGPNRDPVEHWAGTLADCPAGLLTTTTSEGHDCLCVYPTSTRRTYAKQNSVLLQFLLFLLLFFWQESLVPEVGYACPKMIGVRSFEFHARQLHEDGTCFPDHQSSSYGPQASSEPLSRRSRTSPVFYRGQIWFGECACTADGGPPWLR
jgi:hypothetical protein